MHTAALSSKLAEYAQRNHLNRGDSTMAAPAPRGRVKEPLTKSQGMQSNALSLLAKYRQTKQGFAAEPEPEEQEVVDDAEVLKQMAENVELTQAFLDMDFNPEQIEALTKEYHASKTSLPNLAHGKRVDFVMRKLFPREAASILRRMHDGLDPLSTSEAAVMLGQDKKGMTAMEVYKLKAMKEAQDPEAESMPGSKEEQGGVMSQLSVWKSIKGGYPPNASVPPKAPFWYQGVLQELAMEEAGAMSIEGRDAKPDLDAEIAAFGGKMQDSAFARSIEADKEQDKAELKTLLRRLERKDRAERIWHTGFYAFAAVLGSATALFLSTRGYTLGGSGDSADDKNDIAKRISMLRSKEADRTRSKEVSASQALADEIGRVV